MSNENRSCPSKKTSIGGQALMEGIMMRGPEITAMAVRNTEGEIIIEKMPTETKKRHAILKLPVIRGVFNYIDSMVLGTKCLMRSAEISGLEEAEEEMKREKAEKKAKKALKKANKSADEAPAQNCEQTTQSESETESASLSEPNVGESVDAAEAEQKSPEEKKGSSVMMGVLMFFSVALGIGFSILLFIVLPSLLYKGATHLIPALKPADMALQSLIKSAFEGVLKIVILVAYMALVSLMKDIKRTFMYHGAEHKSIFCYEQGLELTVENVKAQKRFHPRCGTSFLILMILVGIFISFFIDPLFYLIFGYLPITALRVLIKLLLLPLIVGIGYELIKIAGRHDNVFTRIISAPGVWLQHITTKEPTDDMIECAIISLKEVIPNDSSDNW